MTQIFGSTVFGRMAAAGLVAAGLLAASAAQAHDRGVVFVNDGWSRITAIHIVHIDSWDWGFNLISRSVHAGDWTFVEPWDHQGYCRFHIMVTYSSNDVVILEDVNLCGGREIVVDEWEAWVYRI